MQRASDGGGASGSDGGRGSPSGFWMQGGPGKAADSFPPGKGAVAITARANRSDVANGMPANRSAPWAE